MTESEHIWRPWRESLKPPPIGPHICRLENLVGTGAPDIEACFQGLQVWVELKIAHGNRLKFRPTQPTWIRTRWASGGRVLVLARKLDTLYLLPAAIVNNPVLGSVEPIFTTRKPFDWEGLQEAIFPRNLRILPHVGH